VSVPWVLGFGFTERTCTVPLSLVRAKRCQRMKCQAVDVGSVGPSSSCKHQHRYVDTRGAKYQCPESTAHTPHGQGSLFTTRETLVSLGAW